MNAENTSYQAAAAIAALADAIKGVELVRRSSAENRELRKGEFEAHLDCAKHHVFDGMELWMKEEIESVSSPYQSGNAHATREFEVRNILIGHCGQSLTPDNVDAIAAEMLAAIETGPCAWAFGQNTRDDGHPEMLEALQVAMKELARQEDSTEPYGPVSLQIVEKMTAAVRKALGQNV